MRGGNEMQSRNKHIHPIRYACHLLDKIEPSQVLVIVLRETIKI